MREGTRKLRWSGPGWGSTCQARIGIWLFLHATESQHGDVERWDPQPDLLAVFWLLGREWAAKGQEWDLGVWLGFQAEDDSGLGLSNNNGDLS